MRTTRTRCTRTTMPSTRVDPVSKARGLARRSLRFRRWLRRVHGASCTTHAASCAVHHDASKALHTSCSYFEWSPARPQPALVCEPERLLEVVVGAPVERPDVGNRMRPVGAARCSATAKARPARTCPRPTGTRTPRRDWRRGAAHPHPRRGRAGGGPRHRHSCRNKDASEGECGK